MRSQDHHEIRAQRDFYQTAARLFTQGWSLIAISGLMYGALNELKRNAAEIKRRARENPDQESLPIGVDHSSGGS